MQRDERNEFRAAASEAGVRSFHRVVRTLVKYCNCPKGRLGYSLSSFLYRHTRLFARHLREPPVYIHAAWTQARLFYPPGARCVSIQFAKTYVHQSTITPRAAVWIGRKGGNNSPSKLYVYQDGGGAVTLKTTVADVSAVTTTAKNVEKLASAGSTGSIPFPLAENYRILDRESLGETPLRAFATPTMLSSSTTGPAQQPELPAHGRALGGGGGSGDCVDIVGDDSMGGIYFSSFGGERDGGRGMEGWGYVGDTPISTGDDGLTIAMDTACCPRLPVFSTTTLKPSSRSYPSMAWPVPRYHRQEQPTRSDCEMEDNLAWNTVTGRGVPPLPSASGRHAQHRSGFGGTKPSVLQQRCGTAPPPPPARGASSLSFHANDRVREKLRIPPTPITGLALRPPTNNNDSIGESTGPLGRAFDGLRENSFGTAADRTVSLGDTASMTAGAAATTPNNGSPQEAMIFPSSVSYTDQISLRLAFGSALTQESWLSGISEFQDVESVFFD